MALIPRNADSVISKEELHDTRNLTKIEAIGLQKRLLKDWEPKYEVLALKYGHTAIGLACAVSSGIINSLFKRKLKLRYTGQLLSTFVLMVGPGVLASIGHEMMITENILLYKKQCPVCYEIKASLFLNSCAILYPLMLSPALNLGIAANLGLRTPYVYEVKEIAKFWWSTVKPALNHISLIFGANMIVASTVVYKQMKEMENIGNTLIAIEKYKRSRET